MVLSGRCSIFCSKWFSTNIRIIELLNFMVHNVNQTILQLWVVHSLSGKIALVNIESGEPLSHSYAQMTMEDSGEMVFSSWQENAAHLAGFTSSVSELRRGFYSSMLSQSTHQRKI